MKSGAMHEFDTRDARSVSCKLRHGCEILRSHLVALYEGAVCLPAGVLGLAMFSHGATHKSRSKGSDPHTCPKSESVARDKLRVCR